MYQTETPLLPYYFVSHTARVIKCVNVPSANLSKLPDQAVDGLQLLLKGGIAIESLSSAFKIIRSRPHGHVAAVLGTLKNLGLHNLINEENTRERRLVLAMCLWRGLSTHVQS